MLGKKSIVTFVATTRPKRARRFYRDVLGLRLIAESPFALEFDANGTMLRVTPVHKAVIAPYTVLGWDVPDIRAIVAGLKKKRVPFKRYAGLEQDKLGIWSSPSGAEVAWFKDPDGNILSLTQFKAKK